MAERSLELAGLQPKELPSAGEVVVEVGVLQYVGGIRPVELELVGEVLGVDPTVELRLEAADPEGPLVLEARRQSCRRVLDVVEGLVGVPNLEPVAQVDLGLREREP